MRAYISYSLWDSEEYVLSILAQRLRERGFVVTSNYGRNKDESAYSQIRNSNLFIGVITHNTGKDARIVDWEFGVALDSRVPALLLVDETVTLRRELQNHPNVIRFNRATPQKAISLINSRLSSPIRLQERQEKDNSSGVAWLLGGAAVLTLIGLLSDE